MQNIHVDLDEWDVKIKEMKALEVRKHTEKLMQPAREGSGDVMEITEELFLRLQELEESYYMLLNRTAVFLAKTKDEFYQTDTVLADGIRLGIVEAQEEG